MPTGGLIAGGVAAIGSGAIGAYQSGKAENRAEQAANAAVNAYLSLSVPDPAEQQLLFKQYQMTGKMDPRLAKAFQQAKTNLSQVTSDPALKSHQLAALSSLENIGEHGGHTLEEDAYLNQLEQRVNAENHGREGAIEEGYAKRGMGAPGGLALAAQEMNNQNMTQKENEASLQAAAHAQQNALQAIQGEGHLAGQVRTQDWNEKAQVARAQDSIDEFNARMNQGVENENVRSQNAAEDYNVREGQTIANQNTQLENAQQTHNKGLLQQQYQNSLARAGGVAAADENQAGQFNQSAANQSAMWGNIGQGALKAGVAAGKLAGARGAKNEELDIDKSTSGAPQAGESYDDTVWG